MILWDLDSKTEVYKWEEHRPLRGVWPSPWGEKLQKLLHESGGGMIRLETLIELNFSIRVSRAYPLAEIRQTVSRRAIRGNSISGNSISVNSTLPPLNEGVFFFRGSLRGLSLQGLGLGRQRSVGDPPLPVWPVSVLRFWKTGFD